MAWEEDFVYPLILLLVTVGLSGGLVTWLTHWLDNRRRTQQNAVEDRRQEREFAVENHRKELEIKVDIVSKMAEVIANHRANAFIIVNRKVETFNDDQKNTYYQYLKERHVESSIISSKLESYFL